MGLCLGVIILDERPRCFLSDKLIRLIRKGHDFAHGLAVIALLVQRGDFPCLGGHGIEYVGLNQCAKMAAKLLIDETGTATRDIHDFPHKVGIHLLLKILEVDVHVGHTRGEFARVVVPQIFGRQGV